MQGPAIAAGPFAFLEVQMKGILTAITILIKALFFLWFG